jgi:3-oxoacyl-[acyl-carrier protein] reductase
MIDLEDRRVLITGGSRGIGAECARMFARAGATVMIHYRQEAGTARDLIDEISGISEVPHLKFGADLADPAAIEELFDFLDRKWGRLDCLVNNAGIWVHNPLQELDSRRLEETWKVNERGPFLCSQLAVPFLRQGRDGNIINVSSTAGQRGEAFYSPYAASKGALIAVTKSWSTELAPDIRVNSVAPGWVDTEMCTEPFAGGGKAAIEAGIPLRRVASTADIAGPILFLASPLARHITGEILNVNGGSVLAG